MITGMGIQCAGAKSIDEFVETLREGRQSFSCLLDEQTGATQIAALLRGFALEEQLNLLAQLPPELLEKARRYSLRAPLPIQTSVVSVLQAWQQARLHEFNVPADRIGVVVACDNASQQYQYDMQVKFMQAPDSLSPRYMLHALPTDHVGTISALLNIHGEGFTVGGASASGNVAILKASQLIAWGVVDVCIVVGVLSELSPLARQGFYNAGILGGGTVKDHPEKACRPFDRDHDGFIYGQGSGCLVLESDDSIKARGIQPLAHLLSAVLVLDGNLDPNPSEVGEANAMIQCLHKARLQPHQVDYINTHGSSSPLGDLTEIKAIKKVFQNQLDKIWINATKGLIGHCLFSAGVLEAIACIVQMKNNFIHPNLNLWHPIDSDCRFANEKASAANLNIVMSNSFGFGGINTSILLGNSLKQESF